MPTPYLHFGYTLLFIDFETTGVFGKKYSNIDVTEIAMTLVHHYGTPKERRTSYTQLYKPNQPISTYIEKLTGITNEMVENCPQFKDDYDIISEYVKSADIIVAHGASFETKCLKTININMSNKLVFDTYTFAKLLHPDLDKYNLSSLSKFYNLEPITAHRAEADVEMMMELYQLMTNTQKRTSDWDRLLSTNPSKTKYTYTYQ